MKMSAKAKRVLKIVFVSSLVVAVFQAIAISAPGVSACKRQLRGMPYGAPLDLRSDGQEDYPYQ